MACNPKWGHLTEYGSREIWGNRFWTYSHQNVIPNQTSSSPKQLLAVLALLYVHPHCRRGSEHIRTLHCASHRTTQDTKQRCLEQLNPDSRLFCCEYVSNIHTVFYFFLKKYMAWIIIKKKDFSSFLASFLIMYEARLSLDLGILECLVLRTGILVTSFYFIKKLK